MKLKGNYIILDADESKCVVTAAGERGRSYAKGLVEDDAADVDRVEDDDYLEQLLADVIDCIVNPNTLDWATHKNIITVDGVAYAVVNRMAAVKALAKGESVTWPRVTLPSFDDLWVILAELVEECPDECPAKAKAVRALEALEAAREGVTPTRGQMANEAVTPAMRDALKGAEDEAGST
jgi:hypothetical protein